MELVGHCVSCGAPVYCKDGFLDGVSQNGRLYCHECYNKDDGEDDKEKSLQQ